MQRYFKRLIGEFLFGLICLQILLTVLPAPIAEGQEIGPIVTNGEVYFAVTPGGTLVNWGSSDFPLIGRSLFPIRPYLLRTTVLRHVTSVSCGRSCAMAVDKNGTLWGWGRNPTLLQAEKRIFESTPIHIMEDVAEIQLGAFSAAARKTDGTLWIWGTTSCGTWEEPRLVLDEVASVYNFYDTVFAIRTNGDLHGWGSFELEGRENVNTHSPAYIASGIKDISSGSTEGYQCLTMDGQVFLFRPSGRRSDGRPLAYVMDTTPVAEQVRSLCEGGFVKKDNSFWTWEWAGAGSPMVLEKQRDDVAYAARADCFVTTDGRLHAQGLWFPVSLHGLSTFVRNLFFISVLCVIIAAWIRKKLHK